MPEFDELEDVPVRDIADCAIRPYPPKKMVGEVRKDPITIEEDGSSVVYHGLRLSGFGEHVKYVVSKSVGETFFDSCLDIWIVFGRTLLELLQELLLDVDRGRLGLRRGRRKFHGRTHRHPELLL